MEGISSGNNDYFTKLQWFEQTNDFSDYQRFEHLFNAAIMKNPNLTLTYEINSDTFFQRYDALLVKYANHNINQLVLKPETLLSRALVEKDKDIFLKATTLFSRENNFHPISSLDEVTIHGRKITNKALEVLYTYSLLRSLRYCFKYNTVENTIDFIANSNQIFKLLDKNHMANFRTTGYKIIGRYVIQQSLNLHIEQIELRANLASLIFKIVRDCPELKFKDLYTSESNLSKMKDNRYSMSKCFALFDNDSICNKKVLNQYYLLLENTEDRFSGVIYPVEKAEFERSIQLKKIIDFEDSGSKPMVFQNYSANVEKESLFKKFCKLFQKKKTFI